MKPNIDIAKQLHLDKLQYSPHNKEQSYRRQIRMKSLLLKQLQNELKQLDQLNDNDFKDGKDPYFDDELIDKLERIQTSAKKLKLFQIQKLSRLAIGKRILNIQLKKKKDQRNLKLLKKEEIELFFRQNRIKRFDYDTLISESMQKQKLIIRPNSNGKGFIESGNCYKEYDKALAQSNFTETVQKVNNIFYANFTGVNKGNPYQTEILFKIVWICLFFFVFLGFTKVLPSGESQQFTILILLGLIMTILIYLTVKIYLEQPNPNNAIEKSVCQVQKYFKQINMQFNLRGTGIQWRCPDNFMYLQVIFHNGFPA